ncbi:MAG: FAD:protein transferase [Verrucomicrobiota bacterium]|jgi:thiamine biosynthesis lipoprotein
MKLLDGIRILAVAAIVTSCVSPDRTALRRYEFQRPQMGLPFRIVLYAPDEPRANAAAEAAFDRIRQLDGILSDYDADSELSRLSRSSGQGRAIRVGPDLWRVMHAAQALAIRSDGAFDITVGPCVNLWRKARRELKMPDPARLAKALESVGYQFVKLDPARRTVRLETPDMRLDVGGIGKGYAIDEALKAIGRAGITSALVAGGGDMAVSGAPPGKAGWRIELAPLDASNAPPARFVSLTHAALATSGDLFQRLEIDGKRYSHILDPHTCIGLTDHSLATVIAPDCMTADSLTKVVSVMGPQKGIPLVEQTPHAAARVVRVPAGRIETEESRGFSRFYEKGSAAVGTP